jgi:uncharacterized surface protein with fasciclin (FAS1) repeats
MNGRPLYLSTSRKESEGMKRNLLLVLGLLGALGLAACSDNATSPAGVNSIDETFSADKAMMVRSESNSNSKALPPGDQTIAEIAEAAGFDLLLAAVGYIAETNPESPIVAGLLNKDQYTVFAPTDQAFIDLVTALAPLLDPDILENEGPFAAIDQLLGAGTIEAVVSYHVTGGRRAANSVVPRRGVRTIETLLEGATFTVSTSAVITAVGNTANITAANISASNGIIHVIDAVLLPVDLDL